MGPGRCVLSFRVRNVRWPEVPVAAVLPPPLRRGSELAAPEDTRLQKRLFAAGRVVMTAVVLSNAVGLVANAAAAVHYTKTAAV